MARWLTTSATLVLLILAGDARAETIFGTIYRNNQPLREADLSFNCGANPTVKTDERGSYRVSANHSGPCRLTIGNAAGLVVFYPQPTRYDFDVVGSQLNRR